MMNETMWYMRRPTLGMPGAQACLAARRMASYKTLRKVEEGGKRLKRLQPGNSSGRGERQYLAQIFHQALARSRPFSPAACGHDAIIWAAKHTQKSEHSPLRADFLPEEGCTPDGGLSSSSWFSCTPTAL